MGDCSTGSIFARIDSADVRAWIDSQMKQWLGTPERRRRPSRAPGVKIRDPEARLYLLVGADDNIRVSRIPTPLGVPASMPVLSRTSKYGSSPRLRSEIVFIRRR